MRKFFPRFSIASKEIQELKEALEASGCSIEVDERSLFFGWRIRLVFHPHGHNGRQEPQATALPSREPMPVITPSADKDMPKEVEVVSDQVGSFRLESGIGVGSAVIQGQKLATLTVLNQFEQSCTAPAKGTLTFLYEHQIIDYGAVIARIKLDRPP